MLPEGYMWKFGEGGDRPRKIERLVSDLIGPEEAKRFWTEFRNNYITQADIQRIAQLGFNSVSCLHCDSITSFITATWVCI
jgi:hypothetical protein